MSNSVDSKIIAGLSKIGLALKLNNSRRSEDCGISPTQAQVLTYLHFRAGKETVLSQVANHLGVSLPTISDSVSSLVRKGLVVKKSSVVDARKVLLAFTPKGQKEAQELASWPDFFIKSLEGLTDQEKSVFLKLVIKMIRSLQDEDKIPLSQMCVTCRHFDAHRHADPERPHHCNLVNAPLADADLRLDCPEHERAPQEVARRNWDLFSPR
jgi:DNA-binding MarR family transcriptional regulator